MGRWGYLLFHPTYRNLMANQLFMVGCQVHDEPNL